MSGGEGDDVVHEKNSDDVIRGEVGGDDVIGGRVGGDDVIRGGVECDDVIRGGVDCDGGGGDADADAEISGDESLRFLGYSCLAENSGLKKRRAKKSTNSLPKFSPCSLTLSLSLPPSLPPSFPPPLTYLSGMERLFLVLLTDKSFSCLFSSKSCRVSLRGKWPFFFHLWPTGSNTLTVTPHSR